MRIQELGHVVLYVRDIQISADFYKNVLGFNQLHRKEGIALFSSGRTHHELLLIEVGGDAQKEKRHFEPGLYHIGFKIGNSDEELLLAKKELESAHVPIVGSADHTVTHSLYVLDPDGNELELYVDVTENWKDDSLLILSPVKPLFL